MEKGLKYILLCALMIATCCCVHSQTKSIDSLLTLLKQDKPDTNKVNHLNALALKFKKKNSDTAILLCNQAITIAKSISSSGTQGWQKGIADAYFNIASIYQHKQDWNNAIIYLLKANALNKVLGRKAVIANIMTEFGNIYYDQSEYMKAHDYFNQGLEIEREIGNKAGEAIDLNKIGLVHFSLGDYPKALDFYFQALKINEATGRKNGIAANLSNIGNVYMDEKDYPKALEYFQSALKLNEELERKIGIAINNGNMGLVYKSLGDHPKALLHFEKALKLNEELDRKTGIAENLSNIGTIYKFKADSASDNASRDLNFSLALDYYFRSLKISEKTGDKGAMANALDNIGSAYISLKKYKSAYDNIYRALDLAIFTGERYVLKSNYESLSTLYEKSNICLHDTIGGKLLSFEEMRLRSKYYFQRSIAIRDELFNLENKKQMVQKEMNFEFDKKEAILKNLQEKKDVLASEEKKKQKLLLFLISSVLILVFVFSGFVFRSLHLAKKQKVIIEEQKLLVEEKNKDIIDSINYAKRIQDALLKEEEHISEHLPEHFIFLKSKDIVSGDFHWALEKQKHFYMAAVDCTGHGVPGAFMSMLGVAFLNEINASIEVLSPAAILDQLREKIVKELGQGRKELEAKDGMDISLICYNLETKVLQWAGANNPIYMVMNGKWNEIKANKQPIAYQENMQPFTNHVIQLESGTSFYLFTDGYADQFGGPSGKKFKSSQLKETLFAISSKPMKEQKVILKDTFEKWKGDLEQIDDVCIIGMKV